MVLTEGDILAVFTVYEAAVLEITQRKLQNSPGSVYKYTTKINWKLKLIDVGYMCNLERPPQSHSHVIALRDERNFNDVIHKISHSMALNLKKGFLLKISFSRRGNFIKFS